MKFGLILFLLVPLACTPKNESKEAATPLTAEQLATRGKVIYESNCIACHHMDPKLNGSIGPAIAGSSLELLEARIMRNQYPAGYTPKRSTATMVALPHLEKEIPAIHAYLNSL